MEENKTIVRRYYEEAVNGNNVNIVEALLAADAVNHDQLSTDLPGREGSRQAFIKLRAAFPDIHRTIEFQVAEGDLVVTRWTDEGTHTGEFAGVLPTGRKVVYSGITIHRIRNGKIVERWGTIDNLGLLLQLAGKAIQHPSPE